MTHGRGARTLLAAVEALVDATPGSYLKDSHDPGIIVSVEKQAPVIRKAEGEDIPEAGVPVVLDRASVREGNHFEHGTTLIEQGSDGRVKVPALPVCVSVKPYFKWSRFLASDHGTPSPLSARP